MTVSTTSQEFNVPVKAFQISVNRKPVEVEEPLVTGLEIKEASIKQGLPIQVNFQLAVEDGEGTRRIVGNADKVDVREFKTFYATASDDNS